MKKNKNLYAYLLSAALVMGYVSDAYCAGGSAGAAEETAEELDEIVLEETEENKDSIEAFQELFRLTYDHDSYPKITKKSVSDLQRDANAKYTEHANLWKSLKKEKKDYDFYKNKADAHKHLLAKLNTTQGKLVKAHTMKHARSGGMNSEQKFSSAGANKAGSNADSSSQSANNTENSNKNEGPKFAGKKPRTEKPSEGDTNNDQDSSHKFSSQSSNNTEDSKQNFSSESNNNSKGSNEDSSSKNGGPKFAGKKPRTEKPSEGDTNNDQDSSSFHSKKPSGLDEKTVNKEEESTNNDAYGNGYYAYGYEDRKEDRKEDRSDSARKRDLAKRKRHQNDIYESVSDLEITTSLSRSNEALGR